MVGCGSPKSKMLLMGILERGTFYIHTYTEIHYFDFEVFLMSVAVLLI